MKKYIKYAADLVKPYFSSYFNTVFTAFFFVVLLVFSACKPDGCDHPRPQGICDTYATVENDGCWNGYLGSFWFRLPTGEVLLPQSSSVNIPVLRAGQQVKLAFESVEADPQYQNHCNYFAANNERPVRITCLDTLVLRCGTPAPPAECNTYATAENVTCGVGVWGNTWLRLDDGTFLQPWESAVSGVTLVAGQRYKFAYSEMPRDNRYSHLIICQAMPPAAKAVFITCLEAQAE